jgi:hypothetical protein
MHPIAILRVVDKHASDLHKVSHLEGDMEFSSTKRSLSNELGGANDLYHSIRVNFSMQKNSELLPALTLPLL